MTHGNSTDDVSAPEQQAKLRAAAVRSLLGVYWARWQQITHAAVAGSCPCSCCTWTWNTPSARWPANSAFRSPRCSTRRPGAARIPGGASPRGADTRQQRRSCLRRGTAGLCRPPGAAVAAAVL